MHIVNPSLEQYLENHSSRPDEVLRELVEETHEVLPDKAQMQISHDQGALLTMLTQLTGAQLVVEVGTFTGYSSICIARGLTHGGSLLACDVSEEWTNIARRYWERAGVADRIDLRIAPAAETLRALPREEHVDFAFIDADKVGYPVYYEELVTRLRPGGLIALDNVLQGGRVVDEAEQGDAVRAIREVNDTIAADDRVSCAMLPVRDGVTLVRKH